jgi:hypothetical protein
MGHTVSEYNFTAYIRGMAAANYCTVIQTLSAAACMSNQSYTSKELITQIIKEAKHPAIDKKNTNPKYSAMSAAVNKGKGWHKGAKLDTKG